MTSCGPLERALRLLAEAPSCERHHDACHVAAAFVRAMPLGVKPQALDGMLRALRYRDPGGWLKGPDPVVHRAQLARALLVGMLAKEELRAVGLEPGLPEATLRPGLLAARSSTHELRVEVGDLEGMPAGMSLFLPLVERGSPAAWPDPADPAPWRALEWPDHELRGSRSDRASIDASHPVIQRQVELRGWLAVIDIGGAEAVALSERRKLDEAPLVIRALLEGNDAGWRAELRARLLDEARHAIHGLEGEVAAYIGRAPWPSGAEVILVHPARRLAPPKPAYAPEAARKPSAPAPHVW